MAKCLNCGHELIWQNDFSFEDYGREGDGIVQVYACPHCGTDILCFIPCDVEEEKDGEE